MNASMNFQSDAPLHVYRDTNLYGDPRLFISELGGVYFSLTAAEAKHVRDRLSVLLVEIAEGAAPKAVAAA